MKAFVSFLQESRHHLLDSSHVRLVLGNTSADCDSVVGSLALAFFLHASTNQMWTPVINCQRSEFKARVESWQHVVRDCKIQEERLVFWDDLPETKNIVEVCLFDHNQLDEEQAVALGSDTQSKVTRIVDHHVDNNFYPAS